MFLGKEAQLRGSSRVRHFQNGKMTQAPRAPADSRAKFEPISC